jgi:chromate transporter
METLQLLWSFAKVGIFGFGGGPSMIPLIQEEVVEVQRWLSQDEFLDAFAFGNALPGPITTKIAGYVGFKVAGWPGAVAGLIGMSVPTMLAMIALGGLYLRFRESPLIEAFLKGVRPVVIALLALVVWEFAPRAFGAPPQWLANWALWGLAIVAFALAVRFGVHPAVLIVAGGVAGLLFLR